MLPVCEQLRHRRDPMEPARRRLAVGQLPQGRRLAGRQPARADDPLALRHVDPGQPGQARGRPGARRARRGGRHAADRDGARVRHQPSAPSPPRSSGRARWSSSRASCRRSSGRSARDVLDRIDEIVPPGTNVNQGDTGWDPPWLTDSSLRRRYAAPARARPMRIFSGIQPTGRKHLGNYIGAIAQYVSSQERGEGIFCIVDLHAITVAYDPAELRERLYDTTAILLAAGLDPTRCILFRQSDVPEHTELTWLLSQRHRARAPAAHAPVPRQVAGAARAGLAPGCCCTRCCRPPTCSPTAPRRCRSARISASTWS